MTNGKEFLLSVQWDDQDPPILGEGISRTSNKRAVLYDVLVVLNGRPMTTTVRATSKAEAIKFSKNRYPRATSITSTGKHK